MEKKPTRLGCVFKVYFCPMRTYTPPQAHAQGKGKALPKVILLVSG